MKMKPLFATLLILFAVCLGPGTNCLLHSQQSATVRENHIDVGGAELALTRHFFRIKRFLVGGIPAAFPCQIYLARPRM